MRLVGHKGADLIAPGNTLESFAAAVEAGVDTIEFDVLWLQGCPPAAGGAGASSWSPTTGHDAERRTPLALTEALDAFLAPPLDKVEIDLDIKLPGREEEIVAALLERDLVEPGDDLDDGAATRSAESSNWNRACGAAGPIPR